MSGFSLPRFAKTGNKKLDVGQGVDSPGTKSPSFFRTLKAKLKTARHNMGSHSFDEDDATPDRSTFGSSGKPGGARSIHAFAWGSHGSTPHAGHSTLQDCAAEGDMEGVKRLLNLGEDVNGIDELGNTALHYAAENGFEEIAALLLSRGADANAANEDGDTALHKATINNYVNVLALLVAGEADVNAQSCTGWTALHEAACNGRLEATKTLLHVGADVHRRTKEGDTALHKAARWGRVEIVKLLLLVGADPWAQDKSGREPGQRTNTEEIIQLLKAQKLEQGSPSTSSSRRSSPKKTPSAAERSTPRATSDEWDLADQRELYEVQWTMFASNKDPQRRITYGDVPWPGHSSSSADILEVVLYGTMGAEDKKRRLRSELLRWHPDKFQALFGRNLWAEDSARILARVKEISQVINVASK